jgi:triphosphoribosyl-dephospho-CoA synthase
MASDAGDLLPRRHDRVWLGPSWEEALRSSLAPRERAAARAWAAAGRPFVATRRDPARPGAVALGLALPAGSAPRRVAFAVDAGAVVRVAPPLALAEALRSAPPAWRASLAALDAAARRAGLVLRVHGSLAWQHLSEGAPHLGASSDVDLLVRPRDADALARALRLLEEREGWDGPRLDGEVILPGERGVAWRELAGGAARVLVKSALDVALLPRGRALAALAAPPPAPLPARAVGARAIAALREELETWPKPGLVSPADPGAHADMDVATLSAGIGALRGYFRAAARAGEVGAPFEALRALGVAAEGRMLAATGGVNTHRGAIFALGLLAAAAGRLAAAGATPAPGALRDEVRRAFGRAVARARPREASSHGAVVGRRHGVGGARAEAAAGFPHLFEVALPALEGALRRGASRRAAAVEALLATVAVLPDTNLLWRGGAAGLAFARDSAREFLRGGGVHRSGWEERAAALHAAFVARRLSPGGSADLLAAALFVRGMGT